MGFLPQSNGSESLFQYLLTSLQSRRQCSFSQMDQAIRERSTNCPIDFFTSSTFIQRISSTSFLSNLSLSASLTPFATKKQVELPWVSNSMRMRGSNLPAMEIPVSSSTSRAAQFSGGSCWFHLPLGKPNLSLTLITSSLEQSRLKMMAPHTGLFSCNLTMSSCGLSLRQGGQCSLSLKRNQLRCFSQSLPGLVFSTSSTQQQKAFSAWQLNRVASSCSSRGRFSRNLATIPSNTSRSPIHPRTLFYYTTHQNSHLKEVQLIQTHRSYVHAGSYINHTKQSLPCSSSQRSSFSRTSELNLAHFSAYWRIPGTLMEPVQLTQLKHWLKISSCSTPYSILESEYTTRQ